MSTNRFELSVNSKNLYEELRELIHSQYLKKDYGRPDLKGFIVFYLHSHSSVIARLIGGDPSVQMRPSDGEHLDFEFKDVPTQNVQLKTSDDLNTVTLEVRTQH